jgi:hypothetical protein
LNGIKILLNFPEDAGEAHEAGLCVSGSAATVRARLLEEIEASGVNYLLCRIAFGNLTLEQSLQSVALIQHEIMPAFAMRETEETAA